MAEAGVGVGEVWRERRRQYRKRTVEVVDVDVFFVYVRTLTGVDGRAVAKPRKPTMVSRLRWSTAWERVSDDLVVVPAYLGWANAERDTSGLRLYATDQGDSPRWAPSRGGRVVEYAINERGGTEGDRYLVVRVGDRFVTDEMMRAVSEAIARLVT